MWHHYQIYEIKIEGRFVETHPHNNKNLLYVGVFSKPFLLIITHLDFILCTAATMM